jgi:hypothetical protein
MTNLLKIVTIIGARPQFIKHFASQLCGKPWQLRDLRLNKVPNKILRRLLCCAYLKCDEADLQLQRQ